MNELIELTDVHFVVPSFQNYPVIYVTGNDRNLGSNNLQQLIPMVYSSSAWHLHVRLTVPVVYYQFISLKSNVMFQRFAIVRKSLTIIDEEYPPQDPLSRCDVVSVLMMQDRCAQTTFPMLPSKPYLVIAFIPFLPRNAQPVIMAQNAPSLWKNPLYLQFRGGRMFGIELDNDIGEFKLCLLYDDGSLEWEGQFNRRIASQVLPVQQNIVFSHTRRFHFEFFGTEAPKFRHFSQYDAFIKGLDHSTQFIIINPFFADSAVGIDMDLESFEENLIPSMQEILQALDDFFANDSFEGVIIALSVFDFLNASGSFAQIEDDPHAYNSQHKQKRVFNLFWNRLRYIDDSAHAHILVYAWRYMYLLKQFIALKSKLRDVGKVVALQMKSDLGMDRYLQLFDVNIPRYYQNFAGIGFYGGELDVQDNFIMCQRDGNSVKIGDQFIFYIR